jgi:hypothetical protein
LLLDEALKLSPTIRSIRNLGHDAARLPHLFRELPSWMQESRRREGCLPHLGGDERPGW